MTTTDPATTGAAAGPAAGDPVPSDPVRDLAHEFVRQARMLHVLKSGLHSALPQGLEGAEIPLLMQLVKCGPRRQGELADLAMLDASTVSRYVGQLARRGLVERRPDPADGRAVQLVATDRGHEAAHTMLRRRDDMLRQVLTDWSDDDLRVLTALLARFNDDLEAARGLLGPPSWPAPGAATSGGSSPGGTAAPELHASDAGPTGDQPEEN